MIQFCDVTKKYGEGETGLKNISMTIQDGEFLFLVGPSGAGKTTFIRLLLKEMEPDSGCILYDDQDIAKLKKRKIPYYRRQMGVVFQDFRLLDKMTVYENVAFAMEAVHQKKKMIRLQVPHVLELVGIGDKADLYPGELSGGEAQRAAIARAMINDPSVLIADEPTGNLDPENSREIMNLLNQINLRGTTVVMVTHARDLVDRMGKRVVNLENGRIVRDEPAGHFSRTWFSGVEEAVKQEPAGFEEQVREQRYQQRLRQIQQRRKKEEHILSEENEIETVFPEQDEYKSRSQNVPDPGQEKRGEGRSFFFIRRGGTQDD